MPSNKNEEAEQKNKVEEKPGKPGESSQDSIEADDGPAIPDEILEGIEDKDERGLIRKSLAFMGSFPVQNPFAKKITPEHIGKIIDNSEKQDERDFKDKQRERLFIGFIILISLLFVGFLIYLFKDKNEVLIPLITGLLSFLGGFGVGRSSKK